MLKAGPKRTAVIFCSHWSSEGPAGLHPPMPLFPSPLHRAVHNSTSPFLGLHNLLPWESFLRWGLGSHRCHSGVTLDPQQEAGPTQTYRSRICILQRSPCVHQRSPLSPPSRTPKVQSSLASRWGLERFYSLGGHRALLDLSGVPVVFLSHIPRRPELVVTRGRKSSAIHGHIWLQEPHSVWRCAESYSGPCSRILPMVSANPAPFSRRSQVGAIDEQPSQVCTG